MKSVADVELGSHVTESGFNRITDFPQAPGINDAAGVARVGEGNVTAGNSLEMTVPRVQFPAFDLLEQTDDGDVLVVVCRAIPAKETIGIEAQPRPAEVLAQQQFRLDGCRTRAGGKSEPSTERAGQDGAGAKSQCRDPRRAGLGFVEKLI